MRKISKIVIPLLTAFSVFSCSALSTNESGPRPLGIDNEPLGQVINYNQTFTIPTDYKIVYKGQEYTPTKTYLAYPDGKTYVGKTFKIDQYGKYTIIYETTVDGQYVTGEQTFNVGKELYTFNMDGSTMEYGDLYTSFQQSGFLKGLKLNMVEGDTFIYNKPINLYEESLKSLITFNVVQFEPEVKNVNIRLTDCYDPSIYIDINYVKGNYAYETYVNAGSCSTGQLGLVESANGLITIGDKKYNTNGTGTGVQGSIKVNGTINNMTYYLDSTDKEKLRLYCETDRQYQYSLVREFNNSQISTSYFPGFTNGYVYMTLTASSFNGVNTAPIQIGQINGIRDKNLLPYEYYEDVLPPVIDIDITSKNLEILAKKPIKIPSAIARDDSGLKGTYSVSVWYNYDDPNSRQLVSTSLSSDGVNYEFTPNNLGQYTIEYVAYDVFNNKTVELVRLAASKDSGEPILFSCDKIQDNIEAGQKVMLNNFTMTSLNNDAEVIITVTLPSGASYVLPTIDHIYTLEEVGKYKVTYDYFDSFYKGSYSYEFNVVASSKPLFEMNYIPTSGYAIKGATYSLENVNAYMYTSNGKVKQELVGSIKYGNGNYNSVGFNKDEFKIESNESTVQYKLECKNYPDIFIESSVNKIVDVAYGTNQINLPAYFDGPFTGTADINYVSYISDTFGTEELNFVNKLSLEGFRLRFSSSEGKAPVSVKVVLTDFYDSNNFHEFFFTGTNCLIDDGLVAPLSSNWQAGAFLDLSYSKGKINIGTEAFNLENDFTNNLMTLKIELDGLVENRTEFRVTNVNNQVFNSSVKIDGVKPVIIASYPSCVATTNDVITLTNPVFYDVLSPSPSNKGNLNVTYMNYKDDVENVVTTDGVTLKSVKDFSRTYSFSTKEYGLYLITYSFFDGMNNRVNNEGSINVIDMIAPTISFANPTYSCGAGILRFQEYTASDNVTAAEDLEVWYVVYTKDGIWKGTIRSNSEDSLIVNEKGEYVVYGYCIDKEGNSSFASYIMYIN